METMDDCRIGEPKGREISQGCLCWGWLMIKVCLVQYIYQNENLILMALPVVTKKARGFEIIPASLFVYCQTN
jgi:hypothetical protein